MSILVYQKTEEQKPSHVLTKKDFVRRYQRGLFGNASPTWDKPIDIPSINPTTLYHIRNRVAGAQTWYNIVGTELRYKWFSLLAEGYLAEELYISEMAPTHLTTLQGEVRQSERSLDLTYTRVKKPMREAFAEKTEYATGYKAWALLAQNFNAVSFDWLVELFRLYPEHVIEFSCYSTNWGTLPQFNVVTWEVRSY